MVDDPGQLLITCVSALNAANCQENMKIWRYGNISACLGRRLVIPIVVILFICPFSQLLFSVFDFYLNTHDTRTSQIAHPKMILEHETIFWLRQVCLHFAVNLFPLLSPLIFGSYFRL